MYATSQDVDDDLELVQQFSFDGDEMDDIVVTVSEPVSHVTKTPIEEMPPLQETVDCDALEGLFDLFCVEGVVGVGQVQFPFHDCTVRIDTTGTVQIYDERRLASDGSGC